MYNRFCSLSKAYDSMIPAESKSGKFIELANANVKELIFTIFFSSMMMIEDSFGSV